MASKLNYAYILLVLPLLTLATGTRAIGIPDEYQASGGYSIGLSHAAMVADNGVAAVVLNPAMIALARDYRVSLGYSWPATGRGFYQVGIVDGKTAKIAAGVLYTGFHEKFDGHGFLHTELDSPIKRRGSVALSGMIGKIALGISGQYVEGFQFNDDVHGLPALTSPTHRYDSTTHTKRTGITAGLGAALALTPTLRIGAAINNLANRKVKDFAPRTIRAGAAWLATPRGDIAVHLDYRERERVALFERGQSDPERSAIVSCSVLVYDVLRVLVAYGQSLGDKGGEFAAGLTLVNNKISLSYGLRRPWPRNSITQAVSLGLTVAI